PGSRLNVAVLLSGGVDSSLALRLLRAAGHTCHAFYLQIWFQEDFRNFWGACPWEEDLQYARQVCESLGVPLEVVPLTTEYWDRVVSGSVEEIRAGRTPNPDMWCNSRVKFGAFYDYLDRTYGAAFDRVASGHYARVERVPRRSSPAEVRLLLTPDAVKDQTYFLANLSPRQLSRVMFPLGCLTKSQVRKLAAAADLANKNRKDSQGICFLGKVKFHEFVREHLGEWPGPILEAETGQPLGLHQGYWFYTVGQRGGIKLPGGPWYVVAKDTLRNAVLVSRQYYDADKQRNTFTCGPFNWLDAATRPDPDPRAGPLFVKVRHGPSMYCCELRLHDARGDGSYGNDSYGTVVLAQNDQGLAAGQYAVFYQDGRCLGCAVIQETVDVGGAGRREKTGAPAAVSSKA
ncbi:hypothetical protein VOLCADRAFT_55676, partial [Volvox carteri f. nagariensis]